MNTKRYTFSLVVVVRRRSPSCVFVPLFVLKSKKERFFEAYEKGVRSTKDARTSTKEALTKRTFE